MKPSPRHSLEVGGGGSRLHTSGRRCLTQLGRSRQALVLLVRVRFQGLSTTRTNKLPRSTVTELAFRVCHVTLPRLMPSGYLLLNVRVTKVVVARFWETKQIKPLLLFGDAFDSETWSSAMALY